MSTKLQALSLVLTELDVPLKIDTVDDRILLQKAVYLAQTQLALGYNFGWYLRGPYSPQLTQDYYAFDNNAAQALTENAELNAFSKAALTTVKQLIAQAPQHLARHYWLELLASFHFLVRKSGLSIADAKAKISQVKPHLADYVDEGELALQL